MSLLRSFRDSFGAHTINIALLTEFKIADALELRVLGFVNDASRMHDQFIVIFTEGRHAAFAEFSRTF
jgi:hypothetical protein